MITFLYLLVERVYHPYTAALTSLLLFPREDYPELIEERKKSDLPEKPKTPQQLWYNHEKKTYMKLHPDVSVCRGPIQLSLGFH